MIKPKVSYTQTLENVTAQNLIQTSGFIFLSISLYRFQFTVKQKVCLNPNSIFLLKARLSVFRLFVTVIAEMYSVRICLCFVSLMVQRYSAR